MDEDLETLAVPIAISDGTILEGETSITVRCHDRLFRSITVFDEEGEKLYTAESQGMGSWTWRRRVKDASGSPIFDLRHFGYGIRNKWAVESPSGRELCSMQHVTLMTKERSALNLVVLNEADKGNEVKIEVRPKDRSAITALVNIGGATIAEIRNLESNDVVDLGGLDRSVWKARVAGGVDLALVSANVVCVSQVLNLRPRFWLLFFAVLKCIMFGGSKLLGLFIKTVDTAQGGKIQA